MQEELETLWNQISASKGNEQINLFVRYCVRLVELKEEGKLTEEEAAYRMAGAIQFDSLAASRQCSAVLESAVITEVPRASLVGQRKNATEKVTVHQTKQKEWSELVAAIEAAKTYLMIS